jgi:hypothetical protein
MWIDYDLYMKAELNYANFHGVAPWGYPILFDFLTPYLGERDEGAHPHGTVHYVLNKDGSIKYIISLSPRAVKVVRALAGPYSHALLKAHTLQGQSHDG